MKCGLNPALVMIKLYVKFNVHKQVIVIKVVDKTDDGRATWLQPLTF